MGDIWFRRYKVEGDTIINFVYAREKDDPSLFTIEDLKGEVIWLDAEPVFLGT